MANIQTLGSNREYYWVVFKYHTFREPSEATALHRIRCQNYQLCRTCFLEGQLYVLEYHSWILCNVFYKYKPNFYLLCKNVSLLAADTRPRIYTEKMATPTSLTDDIMIMSFCHVPVPFSSGWRTAFQVSRIAHLLHH